MGTDEHPGPGSTPPYTDDTVGAHHRPQPTHEVIEFGELPIGFDDRVLRPRPWTLAQSRWAAELMHTAPQGRVLELCSGAGHIGLASIADNDRELVCVDMDLAATECCWANVRASGFAGRVEVRHGRLEHVLEGHEEYPVIIADPPWVPGSQTGRFPEDPLTAIDGGTDGLDVARQCLIAIETHLAFDGSAVLQLGTSQQMHELARWTHRRGRVHASEHRTFGEDGVLVRFDRSDNPARTADPPLPATSPIPSTG